MFFDTSNIHLQWKFDNDKMQKIGRVEIKKFWVWAARTQRSK